LAIVATGFVVFRLVARTGAGKPECQPETDQNAIPRKARSAQQDRERATTKRKAVPLERLCPGI